VEAQPAKRPRQQVEYASEYETEVSEVEEVWVSRRPPTRNTRQNGKRKPNRKEWKERQKYKPGNYVKDTKDYKSYQAFMKARKTFHLTGTKEAQADLVQYYAELVEKEKQKKTQRKKE
jgi:hypothetical protein